MFTILLFFFHVGNGAPGNKPGLSRPPCYNVWTVEKRGPSDSPEHVIDLVQVVLVKVAYERAQCPIAALLADAVAQIRVAVQQLVNEIHCYYY